MKAKILDSRDDGNGICYLCSIALEDYIKGLPSTYQDYDVQREIVTNVYLDHLVETVLARRHIPPIVLVVERENIKQKKEELEIGTFKILDGLQRTFRLQAIRETIDYSINRLNESEDYLGLKKFSFSRQFSTDLQGLNSSTDVLRAVLAMKNEQGADALLDAFRLNNQWFEVWTGLTVDDEVRKMLMLNAGHKPVKTRHQLELLFLNLLPILRSGEGSDFQLVREKDVSATQFSKSRKSGDFHFAHILTSLLSFCEGKPVAPSTGLIQSLQRDDPGVEECGDLMSPDFLKEFTGFLVRVDRLFEKQYPEIGGLWMGREVSLAGLFGALGAYAIKSGKEREKVMRQFADILKDKPMVMDLTGFEDQRNKLDLSKVNIGAANRNAVFRAIKELMERSELKKIDWSKNFNPVKS